jgi:hypothetical protein
MLCSQDSFATRRASIANLDVVTVEVLASLLTGRLVVGRVGELPAPPSPTRLGMRVIGAPVAPIEIHHRLCSCRSRVPAPRLLPVPQRRMRRPAEWKAYGGPSQPSPMIAQCLIGGYGWLQVKCRRCETYASIPLEHIDGPRDTPQYSPPHT